MKYRQDYSLFKRTLPSGRSIYYYWTYDNDGKRIARSTGKETKTAAHAEVNKLITKNRLATPTAPVFSDYAEKWWVWDECPYIRAKRGSVSHQYADVQRSYLTNHILPYFKGYHLDAIRPLEIERWMRCKAKRSLSAPSITVSQRLKQCLVRQSGLR